MELKRLYHRILDDAGNPMEEPACDKNGQIKINPFTHVVTMIRKLLRDPASGEPVVRGVVVTRLPVQGAQCFSPKVVEAGQKEGWLTVSDSSICIECDTAGKISFKITRLPGRYCLICGESLRYKGDAAGVVAREHMEKEHPGVESPDPRWPAGYEVINYYETVLEA